jgi:D-glucosaminate-specific PTS system IIA component
MSGSKAEILLLTHGGWGTKLLDSLKMIIGETEGVYEVALAPMDTFDEFYQKVKAKIQSMPENSLIITDIFGGTTSNVAARLSVDFKINVVSGLSAPILLEAITSRECGDFSNIADKLVDVGRESCKNLVRELKIG